MRVVMAGRKFLGLTFLLSLCRTHAAKLSWCNATQEGFGLARDGLISAFPKASVVIWARTELDCMAKCLLYQRDCFQLYYNRTDRLCFVIPSASSLRFIESSEGRMITSIHRKYNNQLCNYQPCPSGSVCLTDCSSQYGGPICMADTPSCPQSPEIVNVRHYYYAAYEDGQDAGVVHMLNYTKLSNNTAVHVQWYATTRTYSPSSTFCARYYVTFNDSECANPGPIDFLIFDNNGTDRHMLSEISGVCYGLPKGGLVVAINVQSCAGKPLSDSLTGSSASRSMWIWEMIQCTTKGGISCSGITIYNTQQYFFKAFSSEANPDAELMSVTYLKVSNSTNLNVKWTAVTGIHLPNSTTTCGRWYVTVNGSECTPKVEFIVIAADNAYSYSRDNSRTRTLEGDCSGILAGIYRVAINVGACVNVSNQVDTYTGFNGTMTRLIVREARLATRVQAARTVQGDIEILPFYNRGYWSWSRINRDYDFGSITYSTFNKWSDVSGIHVRAVANMRVFAAGGCCRWYFTIDEQECGNPGPIDGIIKTANNVNYYSPGTIDGVCYGFLSGSHRVRLSVGNCSGNALYDCATGWNSTTYVFIEEVLIEESTRCASPFQCA